MSILKESFPTDFTTVITYFLYFYPYLIKTAKGGNPNAVYSRVRY
jgi:hypothetical protein